MSTPALWRIATPVGAGAIHPITFPPLVLNAALRIEACFGHQVVTQRFRSVLHSPFVGGAKYVAKYSRNAG